MFSNDVKKCVRNENFRNISDNDYDFQYVIDRLLFYWQPGNLTILSCLTNLYQHLEINELSFRYEFKRQH